MAEVVAQNNMAAAKSGKRGASMMVPLCRQIRRLL
jgi:hypothetical protein